MKLIYIFGRCFATINISNIFEFHSWNPSSIYWLPIGAAQWAHRATLAPGILTANGMVK